MDGKTQAKKKVEKPTGKKTGEEKKTAGKRSSGVKTSEEKTGVNSVHFSLQPY